MNQENILKQYEQYRQLIEDHPEQPYYHVMFADSLVLQNKQSEAIQHLNGQLKYFTGESLSSIYCQLGNIYYGNKQYKDAMNNYDLGLGCDDNIHCISNLSSFHKSTQWPNKYRVQKIKKHESALQEGGVYDKAEIKKGFKELEDQDPQLYTYCTTFYWASMNLFGAYRNLSTGLVSKNTIDKSTEEELLISGAKKATEYAVDLAKGIPIVGNIIQLLDKVVNDVISFSYKAIKEKQFDNKVNQICKVIQSKIGLEDDISINVAKLSIALTKANEQMILYPETVKKESKLENGIVWLQNEVKSIQVKIIPQTDLHDSKNHAVLLALQDVTLFMAYLHNNHSQVINRKDPLDKQILSILKYNGLDNLLEGKSSTQQLQKGQKPTPQNASSDHSCCCTIF